MFPLIRIMFRRLQIRLFRQRNVVWLIFGFYVCLLTIFSIVGDRGLWKSYRLWQECQRLERSIQQLNSEIAGLYKEVGSFKNNSRIIEKYAREELNLTGPNEIQYIFK